MSQFDKNRLEIALAYVNRMAEGNNPVNNNPVREDDVLNNPNIIRCMFFIRDVLEAVKENDGYVSEKSNKIKKSLKNPFPLALLDQFQYREDNSISMIVKQINESVKEENIKKITAQMITSWLRDEKYIEDLEKSWGKSTVPTAKGESAGIYSQIREYNGREYVKVIYNEKAQNMIINHLKEVLYTL